MERRLLLAIALMVGLMVLSNVLFPPVQTPVPETPAADSAALQEAGAEARPDSASTAATEPPDPGALDRLSEEAQPEIAPAPEVAPAADAGAAGRTIEVRSDLYSYTFDTRGARLTGATLFEYPDFRPEREGEGPVRLVRDDDALFAYAVATGADRDTVSLRELTFETTTGDLQVGPDGAELQFTAPVGTAGVTFEVTYRFSPDNYRIDIEGGLRNVRGQGYTLLIDLGRGLRSNEANPREDLGQIAVVTRTRAGDIDSESLDDLDAGETRVAEGGPFGWAASKSKYFLAAVVAPEEGAGFGGVLLRGLEEEAASELRVALPVPAGSDGFEIVAYVGPQDHERLQAIGQELHNVNPFGWRLLQWFIRPFGNVVIAFLVWMHGAFSLAYGWVLILFGVVTRIVLFPLYQMSMRSQMKQMALQPEIKKIQEKYKEDPPKLQQEMMKAYKEAGVSPLGGCLPMLLPFPILITLFFVFQNTIEFRGVPFMWIPDLSLKDPLYIVPFLMGGSMLLLNWIGQRGMETNQQMKVFTYVLPVVFTFMFAQFAAGLNLYYAASNFASLPQQLYLSKERRAHQAARNGEGAGGGSSGAAEKPAASKKSDGGKKSGGGKAKQTAVGGKRTRGRG